MMENVSRPQSAAVKDIDIDTTNILGCKYQYRIDISEGDIDPPLMQSFSSSLYIVVLKL